LGREAETRAAIIELVKICACPVVIDADALQPEIVSAGSAPRVLTPHAGEFARISEGRPLRACAAAGRSVIVLKGPVTRITDGGRVYHSLAGGPVLARGGSGDLLAGLTAGLLAQTPATPLLAASRAVAWQGRAADLLARVQGQAAVQTTALLDFLPTALGFTEPG
jgi:NAD(P)H-hydrate epimerase